ncbi:coniferyl aldehyde dehydrogenase [Pseudomonas sp. NPDC089569]|uniref:coniferyl aldehyde dehydrogenase n=1 Tax=Pseudomonas sp. NPDC089569 TaxID=3390722 RepID=UPI003D08D1B5
MSTLEHENQAGIRAILDRQRQAFLASGSSSAQQRIELMDRAIGLLVDHEKEIIEALSADFGHRSADFSRVVDVLSPLMTLKQTKAAVTDWMQPEIRQTDRGEASVHYQPLGVVGIVIPWNGPFAVGFACLAGALAAGNRVMIKPSEFTPKTSELMARMIRSVYAENEVAVVTGDADVGRIFCSQPFDHLMFTGAGSVGRQVMRAAAENLVPVTLELGGKSPTILSRSADLHMAVSKVIGGKLMNAGQVCLAPDYVFVPEEQVEDFIALARTVVAGMLPTLRDNPDYTSVINARHFQRLQGYLDEAREAGVEVIELNPAGEDLSDQQHHKIAPTLLNNPDDGLKVMQDEIFGPLLPIKPYKDITEVVAYINAHPRPLGLYWFGSDPAEEAFVLDRTCSGGVTINDVVRHGGVENLPFGGVGHSGMGAYRGRDGFKTLSHGKAVLRAVDGLDPTRPPYSEQVRQFIGSLITR